MILTLYKTTDDDNVVGKVLTDPINIPIFLRSDTDIVDPVIPLQYMPGVVFEDYNYAALEELGRFYFIREWNLVNAAIIRLGLNLDYLQTYQAQIKAARGTFNRAIRSGDYGDITLDPTGRTTQTRYGSTVTLEAGGDGLLSLIKPE